VLHHRPVRGSPQGGGGVRYAVPGGVRTAASGHRVPGVVGGDHRTRPVRKGSDRAGPSPAVVAVLVGASGRPTMTTVFVLQHVHSRDDGSEDVKFIGVYSSREKAEEAVARMSRLPGFADAPDGFCIDEYRVDQDHWDKGYATVKWS